jgi:hypothetical protein
MTRSGDLSHDNYPGPLLELSDSLADFLFQGGSGSDTISRSGSGGFARSSTRSGDGSFGT